TDLFDQQEGALRKLTQTATKYVLKLDGWIQKNKSLASTIGLIGLIADFRKELDKRPIGPRGRQVLDQLMPHLLADVCSREDAAVT
ncbi:hypothetical protein ONR49_25155, partial [Salmonella enterica subsp. enterica serovar Virginia]|nr:hypothetical protein [Salmonella enterica subsp. enterica serovar Virginia]